MYQVDRQRPRDNIKVSFNNCQKATASGMVLCSEFFWVAKGQGNRWPCDSTCSTEWWLLMLRVKDADSSGILRALKRGWVKAVLPLDSFVPLAPVSAGETELHRDRAELGQAWEF